MSILHDYIELTKGTEVPELFNVWGAYVLISSSVSRRVWLIHGRDPIYANIYAMLVGDAGNGKSVALNEVRELLIDIENIPLAHSIETPEGLLSRLARLTRCRSPELLSTGPSTLGHPHGAIWRGHPRSRSSPTRFVNFINKAPENWIHLLNDIYDTDKQFGYYTKNQGERHDPRPLLRPLRRPDDRNQLRHGEEERIIQSGFARRSIFQYGERRFDQPCPFRRAAPRRLALRESIIHQCRALQNLSWRVPHAPADQGSLRRMVHRAQPQLPQGARSHALLAHLKAHAGFEA
mgnify:CR=1 FL=1